MGTSSLWKSIEEQTEPVLWPMKSRLRSILSRWTSASPLFTFCPPSMPTTELAVPPSYSTHLLLDCVTWSSLRTVPHLLGGLSSVGWALTARYQWPSLCFRCPSFSLSQLRGVWYCSPRWCSLGQDQNFLCLVAEICSCIWGEERRRKERKKVGRSTDRLRSPVYLGLIHSSAESSQATSFTPHPFTLSFFS